ncbi:MAG: hypothetical protein JNK89_07700 [Saprospiraceae bacterium]|nr:hypothetical protein [Saprospiraceae bacterium]
MQKPLIPAFFLTLFLLASCGKSTDTPETVDLWVVSFYNNDQVGNDLSDDTKLFTGYTFEFKSDNQLAIYPPTGGVQQAKWGADQLNNVFFIAMDNAATPVDYLMGQWELVLQNDTDIKLKKNIGAEPNAAYAPVLEFKKQ